MSRGENHPNASDLSVSEIKEAIEGAGYAVEVELLALMKAARFSAAIGVRHETEPGTFQEIDLVGTLAGKVARDEQSGAAALFVRLTVLIQVKRPSGPCAFVGVLGEEKPGPPQDADFAARLGLAGSIMLEDMAEEGVAELVLGNGLELAPGTERARTLAPCMEPFADLPRCVHWAIARRKQEGKDWIPWATGEKGYFDDLEGLVQAREMQKVKERHRRTHERVYLPRLNQINLCMVLDAPELYLYDPFSKEVRAAQSFSLWKGFDTVNGARYAYVDVVTTAAFGDYLDRCRRATKALAAFAKSRRVEVLEAAEAVRNRGQVEYLDSLPVGGIFGDNG